MPNFSDYSLFIFNYIHEIVWGGISGMNKLKSIKSGKTLKILMADCLRVLVNTVRPEVTSGSPLY